MQENSYSIAVLISGRGSNLAALHRGIREGRVQAQIACVISSSPQAGGLEFAREQGIAAMALAPESMRDEGRFAEELLAYFKRFEIDLVVLAGFLRKIPARVIAAYPNRMINIHPALLPSFGGKGMYGKHVHKAVLDYGCKVSGATVHLVTNEYDAGPPVLQQCVPVHNDDTPESLAARVLEIEHALLPRAVDLFARGSIRVNGRKVVIKELS